MTERFPYVTRLVNYGFRALIRSSSSTTEVHRMVRDLDCLYRTWSTVRATLMDAENLDVQKEFVKDWLRKIKKLEYDAEDVLDSCEYELLALDKEDVEDCLQMEVCITNQSLLANIIAFRDEVPWMANVMRERIDEIKELRNALGLKEGDGKRSVVNDDSFDSRRTGSFQVQTQIFGRDGDEKRLVQLLQSNVIDQKGTVNGVHVIAVVGMGGLGKTVLVQKVYNDADFDLKGWVCVSSNSEVVRLTKAALESFTKEAYDLTQLDPLQRGLQAVVEGKRFLLVLDDIWNYSYDTWENFLGPLRCGAEGSKVLITTRNVLVANAMRVIDPYMLQCLSDEDSWSLFRQCAFYEGSSGELEDIGKKIAKKCRGLPLAVKVLGRLLWHCEDDEDRWREILNSDIGDIDNEEEQILRSLQLSYFHLPSSLKACFRLCVLFPKEHKIRQEELVYLWMAHDLIQPTKGKQPEELAVGYIKELVSRSFFQLSYDETGRQDETNIVMHHLIHDLAQYISREECQVRFMVDGEANREVSPCEETRHVSLWDSRQNNEMVLMSSWICGISGLRSLSIRNMIKINIENCRDLERLRALDISKNGMGVLSDYIGKLKHLRYLNLCDTNISELPESVSKLYHLQALILKNTNIKQLPNAIGYLKQLRHLCLERTEVKKLPKSICKLCNLQTLDFSYTCIEQLPKGIGMLVNLQHLSKFPLSSECISSNEHATLAELKNMVHLKRYLEISGLSNLLCSEDAETANLMNKRNIHSLCLEWCMDSSSTQEQYDAEEVVLQSLKPHANLEELAIEGYKGLWLPKWFGNPSFKKLLTIRLYHCRRFTSLTPLEQLPSLKNLWLRYMMSLTQVYPIMKPTQDPFPCLQHLSIKRCPLIDLLPALPSLVSLDVTRCESLTSIHLCRLPGLQSLEIWLCENLASVELQEQGQRPYNFAPALQKLHIEHCPKLGSLPTLPLLASLDVYDCTSLTSVPLYQLSSLQKLNIGNCQNPVSLELQEQGQDPCGVISSLKELCMVGCRLAVFQPLDVHLPSTLQKMLVSFCPLLKKWLQSYRSKNSEVLLYCTESELSSRGEEEE